MRISAYRFDLIPKAALAGCLASAAGIAHAQIASTIDLTSSRDTLRADGYSRAVVTAEVRDGSGRLVPDGTEVRFSTTLGTIDPVAMTEAGRARVNLTSAALAQGTITSIIATSGRAYREMRILFLSEGQQGPERPNVIPLEGQYIAYSADHRVLEATGRATAHLGKVTVIADRIQLHVDTTRLVAESAAGSTGLMVTDGKTTWMGRKLSYDWPTSSGAIEGDNESFTFIGPPLIKGKPIVVRDTSGMIIPPALGASSSPGPSSAASVPAALISAPAGAPARAGGGSPMMTAADRSSVEKAVDVPPSTFQMEDLDDTAMWITAKRAALFPGQRIHFKDAKVMPGGKKVITLPYHSLPLTTMGADSEQIIGFGTQGVTLDLPYYLNLNDRSATSLHLGWNQIAGSYGAVNPGFGLDLRRRQFVGERGEETFDLSRFTSPDWGAWYRHVRNWSPAFQTSAYVDFPAHRDLFATGNAYWQGKNLTGAFSASAADPQGANPTYISDASFETRPVNLGVTGWRYSFISTTGMTTGPFLHDFRQALLVRGTLPSWRWDRKTRASMTLTGGQVIAGQHTGASLDGVFSADHNFGPRTSLGVNYTYYQHPGLGTFASRHRVGAQFIAGTDRIGFSTIASHTLDGRSTSMINDLTYRFSPKLLLGLRYTFLSYIGTTYADQEISVSYPLLNRPFTLYWSRKQHRILLEFAQIAF